MGGRVGGWVGGSVRVSVSVSVDVSVDVSLCVCVFNGGCSTPSRGFSKERGGPFSDGSREDQKKKVATRREAMETK